jgi:hypothetical protein
LNQQSASVVLTSTTPGKSSVRNLEETVKSKLIISNIIQNEKTDGMVKNEDRPRNSLKTAYKVTIIPTNQPKERTNGLKFNV